MAAQSNDSMTHSLANSETDLAFPVNHESLDAPAPAPGNEPIEHSSDTTGLDNGEVSCYRNGYSVDYKPSTRQMGCAILPESEPLLLSSMQLNTNVGELMGVQDSENTTKASESFESNAESYATSSSKLTSSDKLSALPSPSATMNLNRQNRSPVLGASRALGARRSLDAPTSSLSFPPGELEPLGFNYPNSSTRSFPNTPDTSPGKDTPRQRVSFDSDRASLPPMPSVRQALSRMTRGSDPPFPSPALRSSAAIDIRSHKDRLESLSNHRLGSQSPPSRSRSPLRLLQQWSAGFHRNHNDHVEDPFVPIDPFQFKFPLRIPRIPNCTCGHASASSPDVEASRHTIEYDCTCNGYADSTKVFLTDTLLRVIYLHLLLRLPALYFSRVARIFEDAEVSRPDIQRMIDAGVGPGAADYALPTSASVANTSLAGMASSLRVATGPHSDSAMPLPLPEPEEWNPPFVSPALVRFKKSWEEFISSLIREWKTFNVVSALLLSAILTMFQIPSAAEDPFTRTAALLSLVCALMSLSYGCVYIVKFSTMRSMYRASRWAEEARKTNTAIWFNVWIFLAMPVSWMSWSMILFITSIMSFVWRTGSSSDPADRAPLSPKAALGPRIAVTLLLGLGLVYFGLIVRTLKSYGNNSGERALLRRWKTTGDQNVHEAGVPGVERMGRVKERGRGRERHVASWVGRREEAVEPRGDDKLDPQIGRADVVGLGLTGIGVRDDTSLSGANIERPGEVPEKHEVGGQM